MNGDRVLGTCSVESEELSDMDLAHVVGGKKEIDPKRILLVDLQLPADPK